jgi:copper chaperone CopZ
MSCQGCVRSVTKIISDAAGIEREAVTVDLESAKASFEAPEGLALDVVARKLEEAGFPVTL